MIAPSLLRTGAALPTNAGARRSPASRTGRGATAATSCSSRAKKRPSSRHFRFSCSIRPRLSSTTASARYAIPERMPKIASATSSSTSVNPDDRPCTGSDMSLALRRIAHQGRDRVVRRARGEDLHLYAAEALVRCAAHGLAPRELNPGLLGGPLPCPDLGPARERGVLGEPVLGDPGGKEPLLQVHRTVGRGARCADRRGERHGEDRERDEHLDQRESLGPEVPHWR